MPSKKDKAQPEQTEQTPEQQRDTLLRQAYSNATTLLREENKARFTELRVQEAEKLGVTYTPKPTAEEKAAAELREILEKFPHLRPVVDTELPDTPTDVAQG